MKHYKFSRPFAVKFFINEFKYSFNIFEFILSNNDSFLSLLLINNSKFLYTSFNTFTFLQYLIESLPKKSNFIVFGGIKVKCSNS